MIDMLSQFYRLRKQKDIEKVFKTGRGFKEDFLILKAAKNDLNNSRFAFIVSSKVSAKATFRNKIRRRLQELVRQKLKEASGPSQDVILIACPGLERNNFLEMEGLIDRLFKKAKI